MASEQPLKYKMYVHLKNGKVLESKSEEFSESRLNSLDKYLFELGSPNSHTLSLTGEISKCYIPIREVLYVEVIEDA